RFKSVGDEKVGHGLFQRREFRHDRTTGRPVGGSASTLEVHDASPERRAWGFESREGRGLKAGGVRGKTQRIEIERARWQSLSGIVGTRREIRSIWAKERFRRHDEIRPVV